MRWVLLTPAVLVLLGLTVFPTIYMFTVSFQKFNPADPSANEFIGLANFARLFSDDKFLNALQNTLLFTSVAVAAEFVIGLSFALFADKYIRRLNFIKTILLIPMMLPPIAVAITWKLLYQPQFGVINDILFRLGIEPVLWTASVNTAMLSIILVDIWEWTPFIFLMMLARRLAERALRGGGTRRRRRMAEVPRSDLAVSPTRDHDHAAAPDHGCVPPVRSGLHSDPRWSGGVHRDAQLLHIQSRLPVLRHRLRGGDLALHAVLDRRLQHLVH
jgi:ABC-type polysaccharide transport system permease subunit